MAKVGYLDPLIIDNSTYLSWVVTHSIKDSCFQAHIRKFFYITGELSYIHLTSIWEL